MARWLATATDENGEQKAAIIEDSEGTRLPHGDHAFIIERLSGCDHLDLIVELPDSFRPEVFDATTAEEVAIVFIDV